MWQVYLAYVDSVQLYHSATCTMSQAEVSGSMMCSDKEGCSEERKKIVRALLMGYV